MSDNVTRTDLASTPTDRVETENNITQSWINVPINIKFMAYMRQSIIYLQHGPNAEKYGLRAKILELSYRLQELIIACEKRYFKKTTLSELDITHEQIRRLWYLYFKLGYLSYKKNRQVDQSHAEVLALHRYGAITKLINELGAMIGAWIKNNNQTLQTAKERVKVSANGK